MLNLLKLESKSNKKLRTLNKHKIQAEDYVDEENTQQDEYQSALPFTENFQQNNYIKQENIDEENIDEEIIEEENDDEYIEAEDNNLWYKKIKEYNNVQEDDYHNTNIFDDTDYYDNVNFKERFNQDDIIEEFY